MEWIDLAKCYEILLHESPGCHLNQRRSYHLHEAFGVILQTPTKEVNSPYVLQNPDRIIKKKVPGPPSPPLLHPRVNRGHP